MRTDSTIYRDAERILDGGFCGTYGELGQLVGTNGQAAGSLVRKYARRRPHWDHDRVVSKRTGRPAYLR